MPQLTLQQAFELAVQHQQAGRLQEAEGILRQILSSRPDYADALHFLGLIVYQNGHAQVGIDLLQRAIAINPQSAYHCNLGRMFAESERFDEAFQSYSNALRLRPDNFEALHNLTMALLASNQIDAAIETAQRALKLRPAAYETLNALGQSLHKKGRSADAAAALRRAVELNPSYAGAWTNLGIALESAGDLVGASEAAAQAVRLDPNNASFRNNFGTIMQSADNQDAAAQAFSEAIRLAPQNPDGYFNLGNALHAKMQYDAAIDAFRKAIELRPKDAGKWNNLALAFHYKGDYANELQTYRIALSLDAQSPLVQYNFGLYSLLMGDFENGWKGYEYRIHTKELKPAWLQFPQPRWDGGDLNGRRILIHAEQALGDTFQFIRYVPQVAQRGGEVILQVQPDLFKLFKTFTGAMQVISREDPLPEFDVQCSLQSLPLVLHDPRWTIPNQVPYIFPDAQSVERWRSKLAGERRLKIGLFWHGRQKPNPHRSIRLERLASLAQIRDVAFISLQKGDGSDQARTPGMELSDWTDEIADFSDTAALLANLDLVITIDSAIAHLAGAMGRPTWVLLPFVPDWRWMLERTDSPWYPTMKLFRQPHIGDWETVVAQIAETLRSFGHAGDAA